MANLVGLFGPPSYDQLYESPFEWEGYEGWTGPDRGVDACHMATVGYVCFDYIRQVSWRDVGLWVTFSDLMVNEDADPGDDDYWLQVPPNLRGYSYRASGTGATARTVGGITIGSTVADLRRVYGDAVSFALGCGDVPEYSVVDPSSTDGGRLYGFLSLGYGEPGEWEIIESGHVDPASLDPDGTVISIEAGAGSSC